MINTGFGIAGLIDIASDAGIPRGGEDFGQTFGHWGIPQGPFLFIPLWGPTTVRDGTGTLLRFVWSPTNEIPNVALRNVIYGLGAVDLRAQALGATSLLEQASLDRRFESKRGTQIGEATTDTRRRHTHVERTHPCTVVGD